MADPRRLTTLVVIHHKRCLLAHPGVARSIVGLKRFDAIASGRA
jgi:hypothetical protein